MKAIQLGDISRKLGGLSRVLREVEETGDPIVIRRDNEDRFIIMSALPGIVEYLEWYSSRFEVVGRLGRTDDGTQRLYRHLLMEMAIGDVARRRLVEWGVPLEELTEGKGHEVLFDLWRKVKDTPWQESMKSIILLNSWIDKLDDSSSLRQQIIQMLNDEKAKMKTLSEEV